MVTRRGGGPLEMTAHLEGPYGNPELDIEGTRYKLFLLISGGIGITPMQSLATSLMHEHEVYDRPLKKVWFVWSCSDTKLLDSDLPHDKLSVAKSALPVAFQPNNIGAQLDPHLAEKWGLVKGSDDVIMHTEFYLTRARGKDREVGNIYPELQPCLKFGRPDLERIFSTFRGYAQKVGESRIAVLVCGPSVLVDSSRAAAAQHSTNSVTFDFHSETFEF